MTKRHMTLNALRPKAVWRRYVRHLQRSIVPKPYSHQVNMNVVVKKGQKSGTALIPCTIYAMDHSIDLNPALIRKTTKESVTSFDPEAKLRFVEDDSIDTYVVKGTDVHYNPNNIAIEMTKDEKKRGYALNTVSLQEYDRCPHCAQKVVLAEVAQTRYRSCPEIHVTLADKAKADTVIPVQFGVNKADVAHWRRAVIMVVVACAWATAYLVSGHDYVVKPTLDWMAGGLRGFVPNGGLVPGAAGTALAWATKAIAVVVIWVFFIPKIIYKMWKLGQWYTSVKDWMVKTPYAK